MTGMRAKLAVRIAALGAATMGLSACYYDAGVGLGYYDDGYSYYDDGYGCDPYSPFDRYYDCDYRGGFYNIGYGGGWYQDYWYPGYGFYIFDRGGRRYNMHDNHRRYWAGRRHEWYREHHRNRDGHDGRRGHDNRRNYNGSMAAVSKTVARVMAIAIRMRSAMVNPKSGSATVVGMAVEATVVATGVGMACKTAVTRYNKYRP
jgi:hypothetical protein